MADKVYVKQEKGGEGEDEKQQQKNIEGGDGRKRGRNDEGSKRWEGEEGERNVRSMQRAFKEYPFRLLFGCTNGFHDLLAKGDSGALYKGTIGGRISSMPEYVVVKCFNEDHLHGHKEFLRDLEDMKQLSHPCIVKMKGSCVSNEKRHILVYEYVPGGKSLKYYLSDSDRRKNLTWEDRLSIAYEVAGALAYLHEKNIAYRDLKAASILINEDGKNYRVKLADFGFVKDDIIGVEEKIANRIIGSPGYVDPASFNTGHLSVITDVYSFGIILFELITGQKVHSSSGADTLMELVRDYSASNDRYLKFVDRQLRDVDQRLVAHVADIAFSCVAPPDGRITIRTAETRLWDVIREMYR